MSADFVMFPLPEAQARRCGYTHSGRFTIDGVHYHVEAHVVPEQQKVNAGVQHTVMEHFEGRLVKADQRQGNLL